MKYLNVLLFGIISAVIISCSSPTGSEIKGTISDASDMTIYFDKQGLDNTNEALQNTKANSNGEFSLKLPDGFEPGAYRIRAGAKSADLVLGGDEKQVTLEGNLKSFGDLSYKVTGAPLTEKYLEIIQKFVNKEIDTKALADMAKGDLNPLIGFLVSSKMFRFSPDFIDMHESVAKNLTSQYADLRMTKMYTDKLGAVKAQYARKLANEKVKLGQPAPDIALPGLDGKVRKLSDMQGKLVLLDFWASWCGPCRKANPHVVDVYKRYKDQGFDVYSVSLDGLATRDKKRFNTDDQVEKQLNRSKDRWKAAIAKDNLVWDAHVSDLKKWESVAAGAYGVSSIPKTFLINRDGTIAAINPRNDLEQKVKQFL